MHYPLEYVQRLYRPPSEANSLIIQVTFGCTWNQCAFCEMYNDKKFKTRNEDAVLKEINTIGALTKDVRKVFLADGNPMALSTRRLLTILKALNDNFPKINRISTYSLPRDLLAKSPEELKEVRSNGLKMIYVGIESGDDEVLKHMNKNETFDTTAKGLLKAKEAGIKVSAIILNGVGGLEYSQQHAINSAKVLNEIQPEYASVLVLSFPYGIDRYKERFAGNYVPMSILDLLREMEIFIEHTELDATIFRSNHASNYLVLSGILSRDKQDFLERLKHAIDNPELANLRQEWQRGL